MVRVILIALLGLIAAVGVATYFLRPEPPRIPLDSDHGAWQNDAACLNCHGPGQKNARKPTHPNANDCRRCHLFAEPA